MATPKRKGSDLNVTAFNTLNEFLTKNESKPPQDAAPIAAALGNAELRRQLMREMGRRGGLKGGKARADKMSPAARKQIAKKAARARWTKEKDGKQ